MSTSIDGIYFNIRNNTPIVGVPVTAQSVDGYSEGSATTDSNGRFTITGLTDKFWLAKATAQVDELGVFYLIPNPTFHRDLSSISADQHHAGFIGLLDAASNIVGVDANAYITITDDGVINADAAGAEGGTLALTIDQSLIVHGNLSDLGEDDHSRYALLGGRSGGQGFFGGEDSGNNLTLYSTSHATPGKVYIGNSSLFMFDEATGRLTLATGGSAAGIVIGDETLFDTGGAMETSADLTVGRDLVVSGAITVANASGNHISVLLQGSSGGIVLGGDAQWYRSGANVLRTPDAVIVDGVTTLTGDVTLGGTMDGVDIAARDHAEAHGSSAHSGKIGEAPITITIPLSKPLPAATNNATLDDDWLYKSPWSNEAQRISRWYIRFESNLAANATFQLFENGSQITGAEIAISSGQRDASVDSFTEVTLADGDSLEVHQTVGNAEDIGGRAYLYGDQDVVQAVTYA